MTDEIDDSLEDGALELEPCVSRSCAADWLPELPAHGDDGSVLAAISEDSSPEWEEG
jgi:hypothetical protein